MRKEYRVTITADIEDIKKYGIIGVPEDPVVEWSCTDNIEHAIQSVLDNGWTSDLNIQVIDVQYDDYGPEDTSHEDRDKSRDKIEGDINWDD